MVAVNRFDAHFFQETVGSDVTGVSVVDAVTHAAVTTYDSTGTTPTPVTFSNATGLVSFWAPPGTYRLSITKASLGGAIVSSETISLTAPSSVTGDPLIDAETAARKAADAAMPTHESGLLSALPANGTRNNGSTYFATDQNGGTVYRMVAGVWSQQAPGVTAASGQYVAGPAYLGQVVVDVKAVGATWTDLSGMSLAVPASARPVKLRAKIEVAGNMGTATSGLLNMVWIGIANSSNTILAMDAWGMVSTGASLLQYGKCEVEWDLDAPVTAATYKLQYRLAAAAQTGMSSASIAPGYAIVAGARNSFTATAG